jgi:hypothetical protein
MEGSFRQFHLSISAIKIKATSLTGKHLCLKKNYAVKLKP